MAKDPIDTKLPEEAVVPETALPKGIPRLYILLGLVSLVLLQTLLLWLMLPSPESVQKAVLEAGKLAVPPSPFNEVPLPQEKSQPPDTIEKPLGKPDGERYHVQDVNQNDPTSMSGFSCSVFAVIKKSDEIAFTKAYEPKIKRIDQEILTILRESTLEERLESSLSTIRNRIQRRVSENFDIPYILGVGINNPQTENM